MRLKIDSKGKVISMTSKEKKKRTEAKNKKALQVEECLEKLRHTILINYNHGNLKFGMDEMDHIDCESLEEFAECYETIQKALTSAGGGY